MKEKGNLVVKSNKVVEAGYELTTNEQRLILSAIAKIPKNVEVDPNIGYEITAQEFAEAYGIHPNTAYRDLKDAANRLYERSIIVKNDKKMAKIRWTSLVIVDNPYFNDVMPDERWQRVVIGFSPQIIPYLANIENNFTQYLKSDISGVSGSYTIRFYELISQYKGIGKREITIDDLRFMLNLSDKYLMFSDLRRWVIEPSIKEINEKTPMNVKYELIKKGKSVFSILFKFKSKKPKQERLENSKRDPDTVDMFTGATDKELKPLNAKTADMFGNLLGYDDGFGSKYGQSGESRQSFVARIKRELQTAEGVQRYIDELKKAGYKIHYN